MTGILIPEMVIYQTLENITKYIRDDLKANSVDLKKSFLYRLLGLDDDGKEMKTNRYNYFVQAVKIFQSMQNLSVNIGYNFEVAKIISFHIILPSESPAGISIGEDEGYRTEKDKDGNTQLKFCQMFQSTYQIMITSDNSNEVNLVYHIYKSLMIALVPHFTLKGLLNPKLSGNDIVFQDDTIPMGIFHKVLNLTFDYELVVPQLLLIGLVKSIQFEGTGYAPNGRVNFDETPIDETGKSPEDYPGKIVDRGKPAVYSEKAESESSNPSHYVEPGNNAPLTLEEILGNYPNHEVEPSGSSVGNSENSNYPSHQVEAAPSVNSGSETSDYPNHEVEPAGSTNSGSATEDYPQHHVEPAGSAPTANETSEYPSHNVQPAGSIGSSEVGNDYPSKQIEAGGSVAGSSAESYPSHYVEPGRQASNDGREYPTTHIINSMFGENNTLNNIRIAVTDGEDTLLSGVAVQIKSENYLYYGITDANGIVTFPSIANEVYDITLAVSGKNQGEYKDISFDSPQTYIKYSLVEKSIWDGMHSDTAPILYVDIHDGGRA